MAPTMSAIRIGKAMKCFAKLVTTFSQLPLSDTPATDRRKFLTSVGIRSPNANLQDIMNPRIRWVYIDHEGKL